MACSRPRAKFAAQQPPVSYHQQETCKANHFEQRLLFVTGPAPCSDPEAWAKEEPTLDGTGTLSGRPKPHAALCSACWTWEEAAQRK